MCLAWGAPPYHRSPAQVVYAATNYRNDQPLWLFRNAAINLPVIRSLLGNWSRLADASGHPPVKTFVEFHGGSPPNNLGDSQWKDLVRWHDTSLWLANKKTYDLVSGLVALEGTPGLKLGTERLLLLRGNRPKLSWVPLITEPPRKGEKLWVTLAFSGDLDERGPKSYSYIFVVK